MCSLPYTSSGPVGDGGRDRGHSDVSPGLLGPDIIFSTVHVTNAKLVALYEHQD